MSYNAVDLKYKVGSDMTEITKWEYITVSKEDANEYGKQGWEGFGYDSSNSKVLLKRPCGRLKDISITPSADLRSVFYFYTKHEIYGIVFMGVL